MPARRLSIRISETTESILEEIAKSRGLDALGAANQLFEEAVRMWRIPGIVFRDEGHRREAKIAGTGLGVWEVIEGYRRAGEDWEEFKREMDWLTELQLRTALAYWQAYPDEIDRQMAENESWTEEKLYGMYPWMKPPPPRAHKPKPVAGG